MNNPDPKWRFKPDPEYFLPRIHTTDDNKYFFPIPEWLNAREDGHMVETEDGTAPKFNANHTLGKCEIQARRTLKISYY